MCFDLGKMVVPVEKHGARATWQRHLCRVTNFAIEITNMHTLRFWFQGQCLAMPVSVPSPCREGMGRARTRSLEVRDFVWVKL